MATAHRGSTEAALPCQPAWVLKQEIYVVSFQVDPEGEGFQILAAASEVEQMQSQHAQRGVEQAVKEVKACIWWPLSPKPNLVWEWTGFCTRCKHCKTYT